MKLQEDLYVCFGEPDADRPMLPASIACHGGDRFVLRVEVDVEAAIGTPVVLYRHIQQRFFSQRGAVESVCYVSPRETLVKVSCEPEPTPAEKRTAFRAVTAARDLVARIDREERCPVVNVSASGLAAIVANPPRIHETGGGLTPGLLVRVDEDLLALAAQLLNGLGHRLG